VNIVFKNRYMLIVKYIYDCHDKIFCHKEFWGTCSSVEMMKGYMVTERLETPAL